VFKRDRRTQFLKASQFAQGVVYIGYSIWRTMISPLDYARAGQPVGFLMILFFFLMFMAGLYFLIEALSRKNGENPSRREFLVSVCTSPLWAFPAFVTLGLSIPLLMASPEEQMDMQPLALYFLQVGVTFLCIGAINISSSIFVYLQRRKAQPSRGEQHNRSRASAKAPRNG